MTPFTFVPKHQPFDGREVSFQLRPLTKPERYDLQASISTNGGVPDSERVSAVLLQNVVGWSGIGDPPIPWSRSAMRTAAIDGEATPDDTHWMVWAGEIAGALYTRSLLGPLEKKG
jgi:hypothetical protein